MGVTTSLAGLTKPASSNSSDVAFVSKESSGGGSFGLALESARRVLEAAGNDSETSTRTKTKKSAAAKTSKKGGETPGNTAQVADIKEKTKVLAKGSAEAKVAADAPSEQPVGAEAKSAEGTGREVAKGDVRVLAPDARLNPEAVAGKLVEPSIAAKDKAVAPRGKSHNDPHAPTPTAPKKAAESGADVVAKSDEEPESGEISARVAAAEVPQAKAEGVVANAADTDDSERIGQHRAAAKSGESQTGTEVAGEALSNQSQSEIDVVTSAQIGTNPGATEEAPRATTESQSGTEQKPLPAGATVREPAAETAAEAVAEAPADAPAVLAADVASAHRSVTAPEGVVAVAAADVKAERRDVPVDKEPAQSEGEVEVEVTGSGEVLVAANEPADAPAAESVRVEAEGPVVESTEEFSGAGVVPEVEAVALSGEGPAEDAGPALASLLLGDSRGERPSAAAKRKAEVVRDAVVDRFGHLGSKSAEKPKVDAQDAEVAKATAKPEVRSEGQLSEAVKAKVSNEAKAAESAVTPKVAVAASASPMAQAAASGAAEVKESSAKVQTGEAAQKRVSSARVVRTSAGVGAEQKADPSRKAAAPVRAERGEATVERAGRRTERKAERAKVDLREGAPRRGRARRVKAEDPGRVKEGSVKAAIPAAKGESRTEAERGAEVRGRGRRVVTKRAGARAESGVARRRKASTGTRARVAVRGDQAKVRSDEVRAEHDVKAKVTTKASSSAAPAMVRSEQPEAAPKRRVAARGGEGAPRFAIRTEEATESTPAAEKKPVKSERVGQAAPVRSAREADSRLPTMAAPVKAETAVSPEAAVGVSAASEVVRQDDAKAPRVESAHASRAAAKVALEAAEASDFEQSDGDEKPATNAEASKPRRAEEQGASSRRRASFRQFAQETTTDVRRESATNAIANDAAAAELEAQSDTTSMGQERTSGSTKDVGRVREAAGPRANSAAGMQSLNEVIEDVDRPDIGRRLGRIVMMGANRAHLKLHPQELGRLEIDIRTVDGEVSLSVKAETVAAAAEIQSQLGDLKQSLLEQGMKLGDVEVETKAQDEGNDRKNAGEAGDREGSGRHDGRRDGREKSEDESPRRSGRRSRKPTREGGIDLVV